MSSKSGGEEETEESDNRRFLLTRQKQIVIPSPTKHFSPSAPPPTRKLGHAPISICETGVEYGLRSHVPIDEVIMVDGGASLHPLESFHAGGPGSSPAPRIRCRNVSQPSGTSITPAR